MFRTAMDRLGNEKDMQSLETGIDKLIDMNGLDKLSTKALSDLLSGDKKEYAEKNLADKLEKANPQKAVQQEENRKEIIKDDLQADNKINQLNI